MRAITTNTTNSSQENDDEDEESSVLLLSRKIQSLSDKSHQFQTLSLEERLEMVNSILANVDALGEDILHQHDIAVFRLGPSVPSSTTSTGNENEHGCNLNYTHAVHRSLGYNKFLFSYFIVLTLKSIQTNLKYQIMMERNERGDGSSDGKNAVKMPSILKRIRRETIGGKEFRIHGPVELWPLFHKMEVWTDPDLESEIPDLGALSEPQTSSSNLLKNDKEKDEEGGGACVVLGGGNQSVVTIADVIQCLFHHPRKPILIKHHPLRPHLYDTCAKLFAPLIEAGYIDQVYDEGLSNTISLLRHSSVQHVHVTGAYATALAIENTLGESRPDKSKDEIRSMITSELGCATPWIFVPGKYSKRELRMAAKHIVTSKKLNAGCNCLCAQVVILPQQWEQKDEFRTILLQMLQNIPTDPLYYPGSKEKVLDIVSRYEVDKVTQVTSGRVERNMMVDTSVDAAEMDNEDYIQPYLVECGTYGEDNYNDFALKNEAFGPVLAIVELPPSSMTKSEQFHDDQIGSNDKKSYLCGTVVPFVNDKNNIFGSLSCSIISPKSYDQRDLREATSKINYGCIGLNTWTGYGYVAPAHGGTWGGSIHDTSGRSGCGIIGNHYEIQNITKTIIWSRSLTFPLLVDKNLVPPRFLTEFATSAFLHLGKRGLGSTKKS